MIKDIKKILADLKISAYRGRDDYLETLTSAYDLLVRESEEFNTTKLGEQNCQRGRGGREHWRRFKFS